MTRLSKLAYEVTIKSYYIRQYFPVELLHYAAMH